MKAAATTIIQSWKPVMKEFLDALELMTSLPSVFKVGSEDYISVCTKLNEPHAAVETAIDIIMKSDITLDDFVQAVNDCKHDWLADLISGNVRDEDVEDAARKPAYLNYVKECLTVLAPKLGIIDPLEVAQGLKMFSIRLTEDEFEQIESQQKQSGNRSAVRKLLIFLTRKPPGWGEYFTKVVENLNYDFELVDKLRALFISEHPSHHPSSDIGEERESVNEPGATEIGANPVLKEETRGIGTSRMAANFSFTSPVAAAKKNNLSLRKYQKYLASDAIDGKNVIICAPTGSGKTRVAAHVIFAKYYDTMQEQNHKIAFIVPRVSFAKQQSDNIKAYLSSRRWNVDHMVGDSKSTLREALQTSKVIVLTPQILLNGLENSTVALSDFSMLIFDECHHTMKENPYNVIMGQYLEMKETGSRSLPKVLGLTATLGVGGGKDESHAVQHMLTLCANLDATGGIVTVPGDTELSDELNRFTPHPEEDVVPLDRATEPFAVCVSETMDDIVQLLYSLDVHKVKGATRPNPLPKGDQQYLQWCQDFREKSVNSLMNEPVLCRDIQTCLDYLKIFNEALDLHNKCRAVDALKYLNSSMVDLPSSRLSATESKLREMAQQQIGILTDHSNDPQCCNPNLQQMGDEIRLTFEKDNNSRVMLNVRKRQYAVAIRNWLNESEEFAQLQLKAEYFTGVGKSKDGTAKGLTHNMQERILEMYRNGETKVLVCTPEVASEGIDIGNCNLVICYDYIKNEISKLQVKGRARKEGGRLIQFSSNKVMARDKANILKIDLMKKATLTVQTLFEKDNQKFMWKIKSLQKEAVRTARLLKKNGKMKSAAEPSSKYKVSCKKCSAYMCQGDDIVKLQTNHTCIKNEFKQKYIEAAVNDGGTEKKTGLFCKECQTKWGIFSRIKKIVIPQLYPDALVFASDGDSSLDTETGSKWAKIKITFTEMKYEDMLDVVYNQ